MRKAQPVREDEMAMWRTAGESPALPGGAFGALLACEGSLTARLDALCGGTFALDLLAQHHLAAGATHALLDSEPRDWLPAVCREVLMSAAGTPVVFARTLIPSHTAVAQGWLTELGASSLGHALFVRGDVVRSPFEFACCPPGGDVDRRMRELLPGEALGDPAPHSRPQPARAVGSGDTAAGDAAAGVAPVPAGHFMARRSRFAVDGAPLLVMEVFLPGAVPLAAGGRRRVGP